MIQMVVKNLNGVNWAKDHYDAEVEIGFEEFISAGEVSVGDTVTIENKGECALPLRDNEYCLTFHKGDFFIEEPFTLEECKSLFGEGFKY